MAQCSDTSLIHPHQVESLPSVEDNYMDDGVHPSVEDLSTALVKDTFVKVLSNQAFNLNDELSDETKQLIENITVAAINTITPANEYVEANTNNNQPLNTPNLTENPDKPEPNKPSSSTHFCSKLSETLQSVSERKSGEMTDTTIDLSKHDLRISISLIDSMSEKVESDVESTLNSNIQKLEKNFESNHELSRDFTSVQDMGHSMLNNDMKLSKGSNSNASSSIVKVQDWDERSDSNDVGHLEEKIVQLEVDIENYRAELDKLRPDTNTVVLHCNSLDLDPAIATVPHLLDLLKTAKKQNISLHNEIKDLTDKLYHTTSVLEEQKQLYLKLKKKLKSIDIEDDRRREKQVTQISKYYEEKLQNIESELKERDIVLEEDFWIPHSTNTSEFLSKILEHRAEVAEEELQRELSNAGTDKFSDDDPVVFPVRGFRESYKNEGSHDKYIEDDDAQDRPAKQEFTKNKNAPVKTKTCVLQ